MDTFRVESVQIKAAFDKAFDYIAAPENLPKWTHAFKSVCDGKAVMATPAGSVEVGLRINSSKDQGTIDWRMMFQDGSEAVACSRLVEQLRETCVYSFVLFAPPVPLAQLEGVLDDQVEILQEELKSLRQILERN
ncbi:MAG: hypothetical protein DMG54_31185 [Acidobacteria bacterium]|nr:MAG: hypothetical protein DMG54_31185 [Acidobacteriota bacterium]